jgi:flagellar protein FlaG
MMIQEQQIESSEARRPVESVSRDSAEATARGTDRTGRELARADEAERAETPDRETLERFAAKTQEQFADLGVALKFNVDDENGAVQVEVRDAQSDKVIRKIPADEVLHLAKSIKEMAGKLLDKPI